jgi:bacteriorhodopsin
MSMKTWMYFAIGAVVFFYALALALCKVAGRASRKQERMMRHSDFPKGDS